MTRSVSPFTHMDENGDYLLQQAIKDPEATPIAIAKILRANEAAANYRNIAGAPPVSSGDDDRTLMEGDSSLLESLDEEMAAPVEANWKMLPVQLAVRYNRDARILRDLMIARPLTDKELGEMVSMRIYRCSKYTRLGVETMVRALRVQSQPVLGIHVHFVGGPLAGKTTVKLALKQSLGKSTVTWLAGRVKGSIPKEVPQLDMHHGRTLGSKHDTFVDEGHRR
jgi:hypothetical protein